MSRFNKKSMPTVGPRSAVATTRERIRTKEGALGFERTAKSELFLLAASFMGGDDNFYEKSKDRYERLVEKIAEVVDIEAGQHPNNWLVPFVKWLRNDANMRTVAMVVAVEAVHARLSLGEDIEQRGNRDLVNAALQRADEPAEALAYWIANYGRPIPWPILNGVKDAAVRLYTPLNFLKYGESRSAALSMKDVIRLTHPEPKDVQQDALFEFITSKDRERTLQLVGHRIVPVRARERLANVPRDARRAFVSTPAGVEALSKSGFTWENLSEWLPGGMDAEAWELAIPNMGIMALIRNLRNFDSAGISAESVGYVQDLIQDPEVVRKSRQLPFRWYNAYRAVDSVRWVQYLDAALNYSLANVPKLTGNTLVLVDMSGSMFQGRVSDRSDVTYANVASLFGSALKIANPTGVDLFQYGSNFGMLRSGYAAMSTNRPFSEYRSEQQWDGVTKRLDVRPGASILRVMGKFQDMGGTRTHEAVAETISPLHDRVILITDEQSWNSPRYDELPIPAGKSLYVWNLGGYQAGTSRSGSFHRHTFGGLNDNAFKLIPILEAGRNAGWPWESKDRQMSPNTR